MRPYTNEIPKCMVELAGRPLIEHQLDAIAKCDIAKSDIALIGGYKIDVIRKLGFTTFENREYSSTNMVNTLFCAREFMSSNEDLIISYGDIVYEEGVLRAVLNSGSKINVAADKKWERLWKNRMTNPLDDAETFIMNDYSLIQELGKKPVSFEQVQAQYMGLLKIRGDMVNEFINEFDQLDQGRSYDGQSFEKMYMTSLIQHFIDIGWPVEAALVEGGWLEVDTVDDIHLYRQMAEDGLLDEICKL